MATDWEAVENALYLAVTSTLSSFPGLVTRWSYQEAPQPPGSYLSLLRIGPSGSGTTEVRTATTDLLQPAGSEVELRVSVLSEFTLRVQAYTAATTGNAAAASILGELRLGLRLESKRAALLAAGLVLVEAGAVRDLSAIAGTQWQGRAAVELRVRLVETMAERLGYIATAEVETSITH